MSLISLHLLRSLAAPFVWGLLALTGLLLVTQLNRLIDTFGGSGLGPEIMIEAIILALPAVVTLTLPMATLVATLYAFTNLTSDSEVVALYSNGVSVWRMARPAILAAIVVTVANFLVYDQIVPISNTRFRSLNRDVFTKTPTLALRPQELNPLPRTSYVIRAATIDPAGDMTDVTIWDLRRIDGRRIIHADSGRMSHSADGRDLLMVLYHGDVLDFPTLDPEKVERTTFVQNRLRIADVASELARNDALAERGSREKSGCQLLEGMTAAEWDSQHAARQRSQLTRRDLRHLVALPPLPPPPIQTRPETEPRCLHQWREFQGLIERMLLPKQLDAMQVPVEQDTIVRPKPVVMDSGSLPVSGDTLLLQALEDSLDRLAGSDSSAPAGQLQDPAVDPFAGQDQEATSWLVDPLPPPSANAEGVVTTMAEIKGARFYSRDAVSSYRDHVVEYHKKFAIPLASISFVLVGMALALKFPGGGIGLVIGGSLVVFLGLYVFLIGGESLAKQGHLDPALAMYTPGVVLTLIGIAAVNSANRELGNTRSGSLLDTLRAILARRRRAG